MLFVNGKLLLGCSIKKNPRKITMEKSDIMSKSKRVNKPGKPCSECIFSFIPEECEDFKARNNMYRCDVPDIDRVK